MLVGVGIENATQKSSSHGGTGSTCTRARSITHSAHSVIQWWSPTRALASQNRVFCSPDRCPAVAYDVRDLLVLCAGQITAGGEMVVVKVGGSVSGFCVCATICAAGRRRTTAHPAASTMQPVRSTVSHKGITAAHYQQHHAL
jgi:hypothetical protein